MGFDIPAHADEIAYEAVVIALVNITSRISTKSVKREDIRKLDGAWLLGKEFERVIRSSSGLKLVTLCDKLDDFHHAYFGVYGNGPRWRWIEQSPDKWMKSKCALFYALMLSAVDESELDNPWQVLPEIPAVFKLGETTQAITELDYGWLSVFTMFNTIVAPRLFRWENALRILKPHVSLDWLLKYAKMLPNNVYTRKSILRGLTAAGAK